MRGGYNSLLLYLTPQWHTSRVTSRDGHRRPSSPVTARPACSLPATAWSTAAAARPPRSTRRSGRACRRRSPAAAAARWSRTWPTGWCAAWIRSSGGLICRLATPAQRSSHRCWRKTGLPSRTDRALGWGRRRRRRRHRVTTRRYCRGRRGRYRRTTPAGCAWSTAPASRALSPCGTSRLVCPRPHPAAATARLCRRRHPFATAWSTPPVSRATAQRSISPRGFLLLLLLLLLRRRRRRRRPRIAAAGGCWCRSGCGDWSAPWRRPAARTRRCCPARTPPALESGCRVTCCRRTSAAAGTNGKSGRVGTRVGTRPFVVSRVQDWGG